MSERVPLHDPHGLRASARRVGAMGLRYWYLIRGSWPRIVELVYWPLVQMLMWGFLQTYLAGATSNAGAAAGVFIAAVLLWDIVVRGQLGFSIPFLEEMWSRNLGHLLISPLRPNEIIAGFMLVSLIRLLIALVPVALLAWLFFDFNLFSLGLAFAAFFVNLLATGWALGIATSGVVLRFGLGAEAIAWSVVFVILPLACVYYPLSALPEWLQPVSMALPPTHVFEGMRAVLLEGAVRTDSLLWAFSLNAVYLAIGYGLFHYFLADARRHGALTQIGE